MEITVKKMISEGKLCVLSTCSEDVPNTSLMQYLSDETNENIYVLTLTGSVKYHNILKNPKVSFLIDTRDQIARAAEPIKALTVYGHAHIIENQNTRTEVLNRLVEKHGNLATLSDDLDCVVIEIIAEKMLLLDGVSESRYLEL